MLLNTDLLIWTRRYKYMINAIGNDTKCFQILTSGRRPPPLKTSTSNPDTAKSWRVYRTLLKGSCSRRTINMNANKTSDKVQEYEYCEVYTNITIDYGAINILRHTMPDIKK